MNSLIENVEKLRQVQWNWFTIDFSNIFFIFAERGDIQCWFEWGGGADRQGGVDWSVWQGGGADRQGGVDWSVGQGGGADRQGGVDWSVWQGGGADGQGGVDWSVGQGGGADWQGDMREACWKKTNVIFQTFIDFFSDKYVYY